jgi:hypothetical protein
MAVTASNMYPPTAGSDGEDRVRHDDQLVSSRRSTNGVDLADAKQMVVVCDHDSKVLARRTFRCRAWDLGPRWIGRLVGRRARASPG